MLCVCNWQLCSFMGHCLCTPGSGFRENSTEGFQGSISGPLALKVSLHIPDRSKNILLHQVCVGMCTPVYAGNQFPTSGFYLGTGSSGMRLPLSLPIECGAAIIACDFTGSYLAGVSCQSSSTEHGSYPCIHASMQVPLTHIM